MGKSQTISEILKISGVLKSSGYRKIENLLLSGLIFESGKIITKRNRVFQYRCIFDSVLISVKKDILDIEGVVNSTIFKESSIVKMGIFD